MNPNSNYPRQNGVSTSQQNQSRIDPLTDPELFQVYQQIDTEDAPPAYVDLEKNSSKYPGFVVNVSSIKKENV
jgi:hypothetical protein